MTLDEGLKNLHQAKDRKLPWAEVAEIVADITGAKEWRTRYASREDMWAALEESTGFKRNILQRFATTYRAISEIEQKHRAELRDALGLKASGRGSLAWAIGSFGKAELVTRAYKIDAADGLPLIRRVLISGLSINDIREEYREILNRQPEGKIVRFKSAADARQDMARSIAALEENASLLYGNEDARFYYGRYRFSLVSIDAVALAWQGLSVSFVDGFVIVQGAPPKAEADYQELLSKIDYRASFFRHLWLYAPMPGNWPLERISQDMNRLGLLSVGIALREEGGEVRVVRRPRGGEKPPRYHTVIEEVMRQGIPDFAAD